MTWVQKKIVLILLLNFNSCVLLFGQNSDCPTALFLCNENTFTVAGGSYSQGSVAETPSCWFGHTDNASHWYSFTCTQSGTFTFSCLPSPYADFDFALYNITGSAPGTCSFGNMISCNYSIPAGNGTTGIGCANGAGCNGTVNLIVGQTYALLINRYTVGSTSGFTISFGGTAQIGIIAAFTNTTVCVGQSVQFTNTSSISIGVTYNWNFDDGGVSSLQNPSHLYAAAGIYNVQLITSNGSCSDTIVHQVTVNPGPTITINPNPTSICTGQMVTLTASGATTYAWSPNVNLTSTTGAIVTASPTISTTYTVTGTTNGCNGTTTAIVSVNALSTVNSIPVSSVICDGDSTILTGVGATTYSWSPSIGLNLSTGSVVVATPTITTTYVLTGTNVAGCIGTDTTIVIVNALPNIIINPAAPSICAGGNVLLSASGANSFVWSPITGLSASSVAVVTASPITTSTYLVVGIDVNGCSNTNSVVVIVNPIPVTIVNPISASICLGENVLLTANGAVSYNWSPSNGLNNSTSVSVTASPIINITYTVIGTSGVGCSDQTTVVVNVLALPIVNILPINSVICLGDAVVLVASGASTYLWSPLTGLNNSATPSVSASPIITTTYSVTGTAVNGCTSSASTTVTVNPIPLIGINPLAPAICAGGNIQLNASGALTYAWNPPTSLSSNSIANPISTPSSTITYVVTGTSQQNCSSTAQVIITVNQLPVVSFNGLTVVNCISAPINNLIGNPFGGVFSGAGISGNFFDPVLAGIGGPYTITYSYTDANGCGNVSTQQTTVIGGANISVSAVSNSICIGSNTILTAIGGQTYSWAPSTGLNSTISASVTAQPINTITYSVTGIDINGCSGTASINIFVNPLPTLIATGVNICSGQTGVISASGASTYQWGPNNSLNAFNIPNPIASPIVTTTYTVLGTDFNGCVNSATAVVNVFLLPVVTVSPVSSLFCPGTSILLTAVGATNYLWSPTIGLDMFNTSVVTATPTTTTAYTVTGIDANGCFATATSILTIDPIPTASFDVNPNNGCEPLVVSFQNTSNNGVSAVWYFGDGTSGVGNSIQHIYTAGTYDVLLVTNNTSGCSDNLLESAAVTILPSPTAFFNMDPPAPGNFPYTDNLFNFFNNSIGATAYNWNFGDHVSDTSFNTSHSFVEPGNFYVTLTAISTNGCTDTAQSPIIIIQGEPKPWFPSAFTPNNDGSNDLFMLYGVAIETVELRVFDRWGELVFQTNDVSQGWDGNYHNSISSTDVYVYVATIKMVSGKKYLLKGDVTLIR